MSVRFQTQGPRIGYEVVQQQKPGQQLMGLYNTWQSLAPHTRDWITSGFGLFSDQPTDDYGMPVAEYGNPIAYEKEDREKLLNKVADRETVPEREEHQSWEGLTPIDMTVGAMDPYNMFDEDGKIKTIEPRETTKKLLASIPDIVNPGWSWGTI